MRIVVIASYATDTVEIGGEMTERTGGPAHFIAQTLQRLDVPYDVYSGAAPARVRIVLRDGEERGTVATVPPITVPSALAADACIVSTILDEFPIDRVADLPGYVAFDVQGYARRPGGGRRSLAVRPEVWNAIACVKATDEELPAIDVAFARNQQQERTMLVTHGARGATVWHHGVAHEISIKRVPVMHALGAGDTLLAAFVVGTLRGMAADEAGWFATTVVHDWLAERGAHS